MRTALRRWLAPTLVLTAGLLAGCDDDPNTPTPLTAPAELAVSTTSNTAVLTFRSVTGAEGYVVERARESGEFAEVAEVETTSYTDTDLEPLTQYKYRVMAVRGDERGPYSSVISATTSNRPVAVVNGDITQNRTFHSDTVYVLTSFVHVGNGATLTIQPGTLVRGSQNSALFVLRGAKINANGTADAPIVFTSAREPGDRKPGDWGGIVIIGNGQINRTPVAGTPGIQLEGTGTSDSNYALYYSGGTAAGDAEGSGTLKYVRIEFAGFGPQPNQELNSLTLAGVGRGTEIDYVQTLAGLDDSFEWFGGAVDAKHLVSYEAGDDHFDASEGYRGRVQYMIGLQSTVLQPRAGSGNIASDPQGIENDGCGDNATCPQGYASAPLNTPMFANFTLVGTGPGVVPSGGGIGMLIRRGTGGYYVNGILARWPNAAISLRDQATFDLIAADSLRVSNLLLAQNAAAFESGSGRFSLDLSANQIRVSDAALPAIFAAFPAGEPSLGALDWTPAANSPAATGGTGSFNGVLATKAGTFVTGTSYVGAADPNGAKWWSGWTRYARN